MTALRNMDPPGIELFMSQDVQMFNNYNYVCSIYKIIKTPENKEEKEGFLVEAISIDKIEERAYLWMDDF